MPKYPDAIRNSPDYAAIVAGDKRFARKLYGALALSAAILTGGAAVVADHKIPDMRYMVADNLHHGLGQTTDQEKAIGDALRPVVGSNPLTRCASITYLKASGIAHQHDTGHIDSARVLEPVCDGFMAARNMKEPPKDEAQANAVAWGLYVVGHEAAHTVEDAGEAQAACYGLQWVDDLALQVGASDYAAQALQSRALELADAPGTSPEYRATPECFNGSEWDLLPDDPSNRREFRGVPELAGK